jgi:RecG-like helicase
MVSTGITTNNHNIHTFISHNIRKCYNKQTHLGWKVATFDPMDTSWSKQTTWQHSADLQRTSLTHLSQNPMTRQQVQMAHQSHHLAHHIRHHNMASMKHQKIRVRAQPIETDARIIKVYGQAATHLSPYDQQELVRETLNKRLLLPEASNRLWAAQIQRLIFQRIRQNQTRPPL